MIGTVVMTCRRIGVSHECQVERHFDQDAAAGAVVGGSVVDTVPLGIRIDSKMIVMSSVEDCMIRRTRAGNATDDIGGCVMTDTALNMTTQSDRQLSRMERSPLARIVNRLVKIAKSRQRKE